MFEDLLKLNNDLKKAIVSNPDAGIDLNTAEQSQDELASKGNHWIEMIRHMMANVVQGSEPRELFLPNRLKLVLSKVDDGIYTGFVVRNDPEAGDQGEIQTQLQLMTPEAIVQALKAKEYLPKDEVIPPAEPVTPDYKGLLGALKLKNFTGDLHIHLQKSEPLDDLLTSLRKML